MLMFVLPLLAIVLLMMPLVPVYAGITTGKKAKHAIIFNLCAFAGIVLLMIVLPLGGFVSAATDAGSAAAALSTGDGLKYLGAALSTGLASIGAGVAVGGAAPAAIGACSEDPKAFGKSMIFVVMGEGIAIYGLVISFMILFM
ncbi:MULTISPECIES: ATP synthase subunit C [Clostridiaceae]|uniref:ATPase n=1 Tax=Clostridium facile TaxID=2763035 RepID=A0ABR7IRI9_9CLOT|nr:MULTISPECIES: ATP synthase subunit C [Clostridiaceae]MBC5787764.1 ATPase [Clostridium facile]PWM99209.1 MAG: ATPase [Massilioclostridium sp.]